MHILHSPTEDQSPWPCVALPQIFPDAVYLGMRTPQDMPVQLDQQDMEQHVDAQHYDPQQQEQHQQQHVDMQQQVYDPNQQQYDPAQHYDPQQLQQLQEQAAQQQQQDQQHGGPDPISQLLAAGAAVDDPNAGDVHIDVEGQVCSFPPSFVPFCAPSLFCLSLCRLLLLIVTYMRRRHHRAAASAC